MAEIHSWPNNVDEFVGAEPMMRWFHGRSSGVFSTAGQGACKPVPNSMKVTLDDCLGWLSNSSGDGIVWWNSSQEDTGAPLKFDVPAADGALDRQDRIMVSWDTTDYATLPTITYVAGSPSSNPQPPALTNNNVKRQISMYRLYIAAGTVKITPSMITDERLNPAVCGLVTENIQADTSVANAQYLYFLQTIERELANVVGGTAFDPKPVRKENVIVAPSTFTTFTSSDSEENALKNMGYEYRAAVSVTGVLASMIPYITLSLPSMEAAGVSIANQFKCYSGGVYMYSDGIPDANIKALTIECRKAVA